MKHFLQVANLWSTLNEFFSTTVDMKATHEIITHPWDVVVVVVEVTRQGVTGYVMVAGVVIRPATAAQG